MIRKKKQNKMDKRLAFFRLISRGIGNYGEPWIEETRDIDRAKAEQREQKKPR